MPEIESSYRAPVLFRNGHRQSICPTLFRRVKVVTGRRERIDTPDGDFLDLDWGEQGERRLAVLLHGLEGSSKQAYMQGMARALRRRGWDVLAWSFRGCSGEPNRHCYSYHSGATGDLATVLEHVFENYAYESVALVGFSLGGNITLKYLGDTGTDLDPRVRAAVAFSVPCDLASSAAKMAEPEQRIYMKRLLDCLRDKIRIKIESHPSEVRDHGLEAMRTFAEFDDCYTAPMNGFKDADEYWARCSCKPVLGQIRIPALLVSAADDPFLTPACAPREEARASQHFYFEQPEHGGHVGFRRRLLPGEYWSEIRAAEFLQDH